MSNKKEVLKLENLEVSYGPIKALKGIDISVKEGEIVALLGANGAGKTTTLRSISSVVPVSSGKILYEGKDITGLASEKITRLGISQSPEGRQIFSDLTVEENLKIGAYILSDKKIIQNNFQKVYSYFPVLKERKNQNAQTLSGGEQQMLAIGRALMNSPKLLLLDEPSLGLAPMYVTEILNIVKQISQDGVTVVIVEQNAAQTLKIADYGYVLELGKIHVSGTAQEILDNVDLSEAYLGK